MTSSERLPLVRHETADASLGEALTSLITSRRSVRKFTSERIPEDVITSSLELAILAPNSSNLQPWEFVWVRSDEMRARLAVACFSQQAARTASDLIVVVGRTQRWRHNARRILREWPEPVPPVVTQYYRWLAPFMYTQGSLGSFGFLKRVFLAMAGLFTPVPRWPVSHAHMREWAVKSCALAAENLMLALHSHGYDTCPMEGHDERRVKRLLKIPREGLIVMIVAAGRAAEGGIYNERMRSPLAEVLRQA